MQRLRYVRQLGVAHLLYPGAHHSRLEHCIGCAHAAGLMFDAFNRMVETKLEKPEDVRDVLVCAALLHDCGHAAFSHSSENILEDLFHNEWDAIRSFLGNVFPPVELPGFAKNSEAANILTSGAAELATLLFLFSPNFEKQASDLSWGQINFKDAIEIMAALIIGRPPLDLIYDKAGNQHSYISRIVSGDLDADKIDYVSRDAYYAGLAVSVDTPRLLGQLRPVKVTEDTPGAIENGLVFSSGGPKAYYLFGIAPAGVATLEMFVMTRSYLFNRIYSHHKVNAAEMALENMLAIWIGVRKEINPDDRAWLAHLYGKSGDDGLLAMIGEFPDKELEEAIPLSEKEQLDVNEVWTYLSDRVEAFLERRLPYRALAISSRCIEKDGDSSIWGDIVDRMGNYDFRKSFEEKLCSYASFLQGEKNHGIYVCAHKQNPVKENPAIWVATQSDQTLTMVRRHFNPEQLANAYRETKLTQWIYCDSSDIVQVSAAASKIFFEEFGILPGHEAFEKCKLSRKRIVDYLNSHSDPEAQKFAKTLDNPADHKKLVINDSFWDGLFNFIAQQGRNALVSQLTKSVNSINLSGYYSADLETAKFLLKLLAEHAHANWGKVVFAREKDFQADLKIFLEHHAERKYDVYEHSEKSGGPTDLLVAFHDTGIEMVIELKNPGSGVDTSFKNHAGQPAAYSSDAKLSPISFLYSVFNDLSGAGKLCDAVEIRKSLSSHTRQMIFCLGLMAHAGNPSSLGKHNLPVGKA